MTSALLDTHVLIWWLEQSPRLGKRALALLSGGELVPVVSAASIWEIAIKSASGRLPLTEPMENWVPRLGAGAGVRRLPITFEHAAVVRALPLHHGDPFDRMLVAQATCEDLAILTVDPAIRAYDVRTIDAAR